MKNLFIAITLFALAACGSTSDQGGGSKESEDDQSSKPELSRQ